VEGQSCPSCGLAVLYLNSSLVNVHLTDAETRKCSNPAVTRDGSGNNLSSCGVESFSKYAALMFKIIDAIEQF